MDLREGIGAGGAQHGAGDVRQNYVASVKVEPANNVVCAVYKAIVVSSAILHALWKYVAVKVTYWHCKLCAMNKNSVSGKGIVKRSPTTIKLHLRNCHNIESIEEYEELVKDPTKLREAMERPPSPKPEPRRSLRQSQKTTENFKIPVL